jgi:hypothetical protein
MDKTKIPWIECVVTLPEEIENNFNRLINIYKKKSRSKKKLKKKLSRITTNSINFQNNIGTVEPVEPDELNELNEVNNENNPIIPMTDSDMFNQLKMIACESSKISLGLEKKIINYIEHLINKYMCTYIHTDDKTYMISEKNKDNNKIFLKFYFPSITSSSDNNVQIENSINKFGDNIHFTVLPNIFGHGLDGMFHLTFRIENRKSKPLYEYSKYISFNVIDEKVAIVLYDDEKGNNAVVFRISNDKEQLKNLIISINNLSADNFTAFMENQSINAQVYKDICLYIALDIFKKLFESKKIDNFFTRYLNSFGLETIYKMINKLLSILLSTFIDIYVGSNK